jgi:glucose-1-phosphate cytidylyltransferase
MKAVILAGGHGTRISEETTLRPKPMVDIGGRPILWHIMKIYSAHGIDDFLICCGHKGFVIKEYFAHYFLHVSDVTFDLRENRMTTHQNGVEPWQVTLVDTGEHSMTGGRLRRVRRYLDENEPFCFTYGDAVADVDIGALVAFHREHGVLATLTAVQPPGRFGALTLADEERISSFREKPDGDGGWVNGGFFVLEPAVIDYIEDDHTIWEREPLERLAHDEALAAYRHHGYWQNMDTIRDKAVLEEQWASGRPPWKVWDP